MNIRKFSFVVLLGLLALALAACGTNTPPTVDQSSAQATIAAMLAQDDGQSGGDSFATAAAQTAVALTDAAPMDATEGSNGILLSTPTEPSAENPTPSGGARQPTQTATSEPGEPSPTPDTKPTFAAGDGDNPIVLTFEDMEEDEEGDVDESKRAGTGVQAFYLSSPPIIDGDLSDFSTPKYAMGYAVSGEGYYSGEKDLSGVFQIGWDETNLYIAVTVKDSKFKQEEDGPQLYRGDSLEILLDTNVSLDFSDAMLSEDDVQLGISPGNLLDNGVGETYLWAPRIIEGSLTNAQVVAHLTSDGYVIEAAIPWVSLGTAPRTGQHMGFLLSLSDNDDPTQDTQQTLVSFAPVRIPHDPTTWYDLWLIKP